MISNGKIKHLQYKCALLDVVFRGTLNLSVEWDKYFEPTLSLHFVLLFFGLVSSGFLARSRQSTATISQCRHANILYYFEEINEYLQYDNRAFDSQQLVYASPHLASVNVYIVVALIPSKHPKTSKRQGLYKLLRYARKQISCFPLPSSGSVLVLALASRTLTGLGRANGQLCTRLWDPEARAEVLILFPGSGNASRGQGPHEREMLLAARAERCCRPQGRPGAKLPAATLT